MRKIIVISSLLLVLLVVTTSALAQTGGGYDLSWNTIDGGGATFSTGGSYSLGGTIGQPEAGAMAGGAYTLNGGFWSGARANYRVYLPLILRSS